MRLLAPLLLLLAAGCNNPCQQLCTEMARYAEECDLTVDKNDILICQEDLARSDLAEGDLETCADWGDPDAIREWWTCEDLAAEYGQGSGASR